ncbi:hypothetical protein ACUQ99_07910 [Azospirillum sp. A39]
MARAAAPADGSAGAARSPGDAVGTGEAAVDDRERAALAHEDGATEGRAATATGTASTAEGAGSPAGSATAAASPEAARAAILAVARIDAAAATATAEGTGPAGAVLGATATTAELTAAAAAAFTAAAAAAATAHPAKRARVAGTTAAATAREPARPARAGPRRHRIATTAAAAQRKAGTAWILWRAAVAAPHTAGSRVPNGTRTAVDGRPAAAAAAAGADDAAVAAAGATVTPLPSSSSSSSDAADAAGPELTAAAAAGMAAGAASTGIATATATTGDASGTADTAETAAAAAAHSDSPGPPRITPGPANCRCVADRHTLERDLCAAVDEDGGPRTQPAAAAAAHRAAVAAVPALRHRVVDGQVHDHDPAALDEEGPPVALGIHHLVAAHDGQIGCDHRQRTLQSNAAGKRCVDRDRVPVRGCGRIRRQNRVTKRADAAVGRGGDVIVHGCIRALLSTYPPCRWINSKLI